MAYTTEQGRQQLLDELGRAVELTGVALAALGSAYEQLDEHTADVLEQQLFGPVQAAYGRAQRTYAEFADRSGLAPRSFAAASPGLPSTGAKGFIEAAVDAASAADVTLAELQDSMLPVEVGDPELRARLAEIRELLAGTRARAREVVRRLGR